MSITVAELRAILTADTSQFDAAMRRAGSGMSSLGSSMTRIGRTATTHVTLPLVAMGAIAVKSATTFDQTFARIEALAGQIGVPFDEAKQRVTELSHRTGVAAQEVADALYFVASAGLDASQVMPVLSASTKAAMTGMGDASTIAQLLTSVMHDYAESGMTAAKAMNILTGAIKVGKAEPADLSASLGTVIPVASQMKVSFQDVAAAIAQATNAGVSADRAVTGLRFLISSFQAPTAKATSVLKDYGLSVAEIQKTIAQPGGLLKAIQGLADTFDLSTVKGKAAFQTVIGGARGMSVAATLIGESAASASALWDQMGESAQRNSTLFKDAQERMKATSAFQFAQAMADLKTALIDLGKTLIPILTHEVLPAIQRVVAWFRNLSDGTQAMIVKVGIAAAAFGPLMLVLGGVLRLGGSIVGMVGGLVGAIGRIGAAAGAAGAAGSVGSAAGAAGAAGSAAGLGGAAVATGMGAVASVISTAALPAILLLTAGYIDNRIRAEQNAAAQDKMVESLNKGRAGLDDVQASVRRLYATDLPEWAKGQILDNINEGYTRWRNGILALIHPLVDVQEASGGFVRALALQGDLSRRQVRELAGMVGGLQKLGGALTETEQRGIKNLLAMGDFAGAMKILQGAVDRAAGPLRNLQGAHEQAAEAAADQAQRVKALRGRLEELPKNTNVNVNTKVNAAGLDALRAKLTGMGFRQAGGEWVASGALRVSVTGGSPMPAVQIQQRIVEPLNAAGFRLRSGEWIATGAFRVSTAGITGLPKGQDPFPDWDPTGAGRDHAAHYSTAFVNELLRRATRFQTIAHRMVDVIREGLRSQRQALKDAGENVGDAVAKGIDAGLERADLERIREIAKEWDSAVQHLTKLKDRLTDFRRAIRDGFSEFADLASTLAQAFSDYEQQMADFTSAQAAGTLEPGQTAPTMPDIGALVAEQVANAQRLATDLQAAAQAGLSQQLLAQFAAQGSAAIPVLEQLLANPELIAQLNEASAAISEAAGQTAGALGDQFFGKAIRQATNKVERLADRLQDFAEKLKQRINPKVHDVSNALTNLVKAIDAATKALGGTTSSSSGGGGSTTTSGGSGATTSGGGASGDGNKKGGKTSPPIIVLPPPGGRREGATVAVHVGQVDVHGVQDAESFFKELQVVAGRYAGNNAGKTGL